MTLGSETRRNPILSYLLIGLVFLLWENFVSSIFGIFHFEARRMFWGVVYYGLLFLIFGAITEGLTYLYGRVFPKYVWAGQKYSWFLVVVIALLWGGLFRQLVVAILHLRSPNLSYSLSAFWVPITLVIGLAINLALSIKMRPRRINYRLLFAGFLVVLIYLIVSTKVTYRFFQQSDAPRYFVFYNAFTPLNLMLQPAFMLLSAGLVAGILKVAKTPGSFRLCMLAFPLLAALLCIKSPRLVPDSLISTVSAKSSEISQPSPNIIILLFDSMRADHVGVVSGDQNLTPWMDEIGRSGKVYPSCYSTTCWTFPAVASLFTSLPPNKIGMLERGILPDDVPTFVDLLRQSGYKTAAFTSNHYISSFYNFDRSFDEFEFLRGKGSYQLFLPFKTFFRSPEFLLELAYQFGFVSNDYLCATGPNMTKPAVDFIQNQSKKPFFLYLHYNEPHVPYWSKPYQGKLINLEKVQKLSHKYASQDINPSHSLSQNEFVREILHQRYINGVRVADKQVKKIWSAVNESGLADNTIIIIMADHGEEFMEHGGFYHKSSLYDEEVKIPLILYIPPEMGISLPEHPEAVSILDVAPTLLDLAGINQELPLGEGESLLRPASESPRDNFLMFQENDEIWSGLVAEPYKLILRYDLQGGSCDTLLFNLKSDPGEANNIYTSQHELADTLSLRLEGFIDESRRPNQSPRREMTLIEIQRLRSLGYTN
jgi:uncharacterized sulfatase